MKIIKIKNEATFDFGSVKLNEGTYQNSFGVMYYLDSRIKLVTTKPINDYYICKNEKRKGADPQKLSFVVKDFADSRLEEVLELLKQAVTNKYKDVKFKPHTNNNLYIKIDHELARGFPKGYNVLLCVDIYGVFTQNDTAFLQMEVTDYRANPIVMFDYDPPPTSSSLHYDPNANW